MSTKIMKMWVVLMLVFMPFDILLLLPKERAIHSLIFRTCFEYNPYLNHRSNFPKSIELKQTKNTSPEHFWGNKKVVSTHIFESPPPLFSDRPGGELKKPAIPKAARNKWGKLKGGLKDMGWCTEPRRFILGVLSLTCPIISAPWRNKKQKVQ